ncbi:MAG: hypothetical protein E7166_02475 [Firmicutes bacterium]|nr:hypothetical protein [Bacillota bacterium]
MANKKSKKNTKNIKNKSNINILKEKKTLIILLLVSISVLILLISTSYSAFITRVGTEESLNYTTGTLNVSFDDSMGSVININPAKPISDQHAQTLTPYTFTITNTGSLDSTFKIYLTDESISNPYGLSNEQVKSNIKYQINDNEPALLSNADGNLLLAGGINGGEDTETKEFTLRLWIDESATIEMENTTYTAKISITGQSVSDYVEPTE